MVCRRVVVGGRVQGVFFRDTCRHLARGEALSGWVSNRPDGRVEALFEGRAAAVESLVEWCRSGPRGAVVQGIEVYDERPTGLDGFRIR